MKRATMLLVLMILILSGCSSATKVEADDLELLQDFPGITGASEIIGVDVENRQLAILVYSSAATTKLLNVDFEGNILSNRTLNIHSAKSWVYDKKKDIFLVADCPFKDKRNTELVCFNAEGVEQWRQEIISDSTGEHYLGVTGIYYIDDNIAYAKSTRSDFGYLTDEQTEIVLLSKDGKTLKRTSTSQLAEAKIWDINEDGVLVHANMNKVSDYRTAAVAVIDWQGEVTVGDWVQAPLCKSPLLISEGKYYFLGYEQNKMDSGRSAMKIYYTDINGKVTPVRTLSEVGKDGNIGLSDRVGESFCFGGKTNADEMVDLTLRVFETDLSFKTKRLVEFCMKDMGNAVSIDNIISIEGGYLALATELEKNKIPLAHI